jgi:DNA-binding NtrC family response regulator
MTKSLRVLLGSSDELFEQLLRDIIEGGGHHLTILNPWEGKQAFLDEARTGGYDAVILTNVCIPLDFSLKLIAPLRQSCSAKVIVMSGVAIQEDREVASREGACAFYQLPIPVDKLLEAVEAASR